MIHVSYHLIRNPYNGRPLDHQSGSTQRKGRTLAEARLH